MPWAKLCLGSPWTITGWHMRILAIIIFFVSTVSNVAEVLVADCPSGSEEYAFYQRELSFLRFSDQRLEATICYPVRVFPTVEPTLHGFHFTSDDGLSWFTLTHDVENGDRSILEMMDEAKRNLLAQPASVTYSRTKDNWFVLSGHIGNRIYYRRSVI